MRSHRDQSQRAIHFESRVIELEAILQVKQRENELLREKCKRLDLAEHTIESLAEENSQLQQAYQELQQTLLDVNHVLDDFDKKEEEFEETRIQLQIAVDAIQDKEHEIAELERSQAELAEMCDLLISKCEGLQAHTTNTAGDNTSVQVHVYKSRLARSRSRATHSTPRTKNKIYSDLSENNSTKVSFSNPDSESVQYSYAEGVTRSRAHTRELSAKLEEEMNHINHILEHSASRADANSIRRKIAMQAIQE